MTRPGHRADGGLRSWTRHSAYSCGHRQSLGWWCHPSLGAAVFLCVGRMLVCCECEDIHHQEGLLRVFFCACLLRCVCLCGTLFDVCMHAGDCVVLCSSFQCMHACKCIHELLYSCMCMLLYLHINFHVCVCVCVLVRMHACLQMCMLLLLCVCACVCEIWIPKKTPCTCVAKGVVISPPLTGVTGRIRACLCTSPPIWNNVWTEDQRVVVCAFRVLMRPWMWKCCDAWLQGVHEKDLIRKYDSFIVFEEILQQAVKHKVDFVLLGGDLFEDNKPSRSTMYRFVTYSFSVSLVWKALQSCKVYVRVPCFVILGISLSSMATRLSYCIHSSPLPSFCGVGVVSSCVMDAICDTVPCICAVPPFHFCCNFPMCGGCNLRHSAMYLFRKYCMGNRPVHFQILSDQRENFGFPVHDAPERGTAQPVHLKEGEEFLHANYEDPCYNIGLPVFIINGNHDDPSGVSRARQSPYTSVFWGFLGALRDFFEVQWPVGTLATKQNVPEPCPDL